MSEHTAGPWRVHDEFVLAGGEGREGRVIAMNHDRIHYECEPENEANARLMAASPDLLKACRIAEQLAAIASDWNLNEVEINGRMRCIYKVKDIFTKAIKKAKGGAS